MRRQPFNRLEENDCMAGSDPFDAKDWLALAIGFATQLASNADISLIFCKRVDDQNILPASGLDSKWANSMFLMGDKRITDDALKVKLG